MEKEMKKIKIKIKGEFWREEDKAKEFPCTQGLLSPALHPCISSYRESHAES